MIPRVVIATGFMPVPSTFMRDLKQSCGVHIYRAGIEEIMRDMR
ncbi:hypothetical protein [Rossellomorea sp. LJF3]